MYVIMAVVIVVAVVMCVVCKRNQQVGNKLRVLRDE